MNQFRADLWALSSDPHFIAYKEHLVSTRDNFWRQASAAGVSQQDQNKFLGAAYALDILNSIATEEPQNIQHGDDALQSGNG